MNDTEMCQTFIKNRTEKNIKLLSFYHLIYEQEELFP